MKRVYTISFITFHLLSKVIHSGIREGEKERNKENFFIKWLSYGRVRRQSDGGGNKELWIQLPVQLEKGRKGKLKCNPFHTASCP